jgi:hypothetical protein
MADEPIGDYWAVMLPDGTNFRVTPAIAEEIKLAMVNRLELIEFPDITGARVLYRTKLIEGLIEKTIAIREREASMRRAEKTELHARKMPWESDDE